ncbi:unnamed protein product, partial [Brenthis ino]
MSNIRVNLRKYYVNQYGLEIANQIRRLEDLKTKRARLLTSLTFLKRCRDHRLIPTCVKISSKKNIRGSAKIVNKASFKLLRTVIRQTRRDLRSNDRYVEQTSLNIKTVLTPSDFNDCIETLNKRETSKFNQCKNKHILKYQKLVEKYNIKKKTKNNNGTRPSTTVSNSCVRQTVVNLSKQTLDESTIQVLSKGLNFAVAPTRIPYENIICAVEDALAKNSMKSEDMEAIRQDVSSLLRRSSRPKPNLNKQQYLALKNLRSRSDIMILRADKEMPPS